LGGRNVDNHDVVDEAEEWQVVGVAVDVQLNRLLCRAGEDVLIGSGYRW
jgi:hypothetical protein